MYRRGVVIDWMMEVCASLSMRCTTFALAVSIFDRYLAVFSRDREVRNCTLQPAAAVAIFIASKHEERIPVRISKLVDICAGSVKPKAILTIEPAVLNALNWKVITQLTLNNIDAFFNDTAQLQLPRFISKIALLDINLAAVAPALIAAATVDIFNTINAVEKKNDKDDEGKSDEKSGNHGREFAQCVNSPATRKVARRILKVWNYAVASHDSGNSMFVIREYPNEAARIFPLKYAAAIAARYGSDIAPKDTRKSGKFAAWARQTAT